MVTTLNDDEFLVALERKLKEEVDEYLLSKNVEELVDLEEVLIRVLELRGISHSDFGELRLEKRRQRGGFDRNLFLERVDTECSSKAPLNQ